MRFRVVIGLQPLCGRACFSTPLASCDRVGAGSAFRGRAVIGQRLSTTPMLSDSLANRKAISAEKCHGL